LIRQDTVTSWHADGKLIFDIIKQQHPRSTTPYDKDALNAVLLTAVARLLNNFACVPLRKSSGLR
jgi:hypothetical protein